MKGTELLIVLGAFVVMGLLIFIVRFIGNKITDGIENAFTSKKKKEKKVYSEERLQDRFNNR